MYVIITSTSTYSANSHVLLCFDLDMYCCVFLFSVLLNLDIDLLDVHTQELGTA